MYVDRGMHLPCTSYASTGGGLLDVFTAGGSGVGWFSTETLLHRDMRGQKNTLSKAQLSHPSVYVFAVVRHVQAKQLPAYVTCSKSNEISALIVAEAELLRKRIRTWVCTQALARVCPKCVPHVR